MGALPSLDRPQRTGSLLAQRRRAAEQGQGSRGLGPAGVRGRERRFPPVTVQEAGCRSVTGAGATRWWSGSSRFGVLLDEAAGGLGRLVPGTHLGSVPFGW